MRVGNFHSLNWQISIQILFLPTQNESRIIGKTTDIQSKAL